LCSPRPAGPESSVTSRISDARSRQLNQASTGNWHGRTDSRAPESPTGPPLPDMKLVERSFRQIDPLPGSDNRSPRPLSSYFSHSALVVLGDPGAGKTTAFQEAGRAEPSAQYVRVRDFLALSSERWRGLTLYLDGFDEERAKTSDGGSTLDNLRAGLEELGCPRFRLSCRAADWYGTSDTARLRMVAPAGDVTVVDLLPLTEDDIRSIVKAEDLDADSFVENARQSGVHDLLANPQTLSMLLTVVKAGSWPRTRTELFDRASDVLMQEVNEEHLRHARGAVRSEVVREAAATINTIILCGGAAGVALSRPAATRDFPFVGDLPGDTAALYLAARTRVFRSVAPERVEPIHRSLAEYLAATHLARRTEQGLPVDRVLALLTGDDGGTLSDLRGVYAWLATLCLPHSERLVRGDPLGVVLYGDSDGLTPSAKQAVLEALADLAQRNPWFRAESWAAQPFGGLASPDMEPRLREILRDHSSHPVLLSCVLDALRFGQPLPGLSNEVVAILRDAKQRRLVRVDALKAFRRLAQDPREDLYSLLVDIHQGRLEDPERELRGVLLSTFYPERIGPAEVIEYLVEPHPSLIGEYVTFVVEELPSRTAPDDVPAMLDALALHSQPRSARPRYTWRRFIGRVLIKGVQAHGESVSADRLFRWLGLALDDHQSPALEEAAAKEIRRWLQDRPAIVRSLFQHWLAHADVDELRLESLYFWRRLQGIEPPSGFGHWLLALAASDGSFKRADFLFREAVSLRTTRDRPDAPSLDELYSFVDAHPHFTLALQSEMSWEIPDWRREQAEDRQQHTRRREETRAELVANLSKHLTGIRAGSAVGPLGYLARIWFGLFADVGQDLSPEERLRTETNDGIAAAALNGFVAVLLHPQMLTPKAIGETNAGSRQYPFGYVVLAGMDILAARSTEELLALPAATQQAAIAFHLANLTNGPHRWVDQLADRRPEVVAPALSAFWRPHLLRKSDHVPGLNLIERAGPASRACRGITLQLLKELPTCAEASLRTLLRAAVAHSDRRDSLNVIRSVTRRSRVIRGATRTLWLAAGFVLEPTEFAQALRRHVGVARETARRVLSFVAGTWPGEEGFLPRLPASSLAMLVRIGGRYFAPSELRSGFRAPDDDGAMGEIVGTILQRLGQDASSDASSELASLRDDPSLGAWKEFIAHNAAVQARNRRDAEFQYPTVPEVVDALSGGRPANIRDLRAFVCSHVRDVGDDLRHGSTDGYKALWNVDSRDRPCAPRPEDDCRDRLLERIRPRLATVGVNAEPEGHYADDKRADIKVLSGSLNLPVEIKRHYNSELWTAPRDQLQSRYSRDPESHGHGIYLVLWFGLDHGPVPVPPTGIARPKSPTELEQALTQMLSKEDRSLTEVVVLDVAPSPPTGPPSAVV
jgi:hypothetical protein